MTNHPHRSTGNSISSVIADDVTLLALTQQKLEESERRLRYVLEATGEGIWDWDMASQVVTHNRRCCQMLGLDDDCMQHHSQVFTDLLHKDDKRDVLTRMRVGLAGDGRYRSEHRLCLQDGRVLWVQDRGDVVERDAAGQPQRMVGSFEDISERKAAEQAAEKSTNLLREAVNSIAQGFTIYDEQDRLYLCNEAYKRIYETSRDLIVPGNTFEMIVRQGAERGQYQQAVGDIDAWVRQRVAQHQNADGRVIEQRLDGGRWLLVVESRTPSGFIVGNRIDITAQKKAEALVIEHSAQLEAIFALSADGFVSFDTNRKVRYISPGFVRMTGLGAVQVLGLDETEFSNCLASLCLPEAKFPGIAALRASAPRSQVIEIRGLPSGGKRLLAVTLRESHKQRVSQVVYLRDITRETEVERMKSEFLSTAAHELRTPMASIYGFAEVLLTTKVNAAERKEFLNIILHQSKLMADILNELLDLARIEARQGQDFVIVATSVQQLVSEVTRSFKLPAHRQSPVLQAPSEPLTIAVDQKKASQAILNVLSNAYKYSNKSAGRVSIRIEPLATGVAIRVTDQGIGMSVEQVQRMGERFYRADTSGKVPGTGLGMSIVTKIMALHQGTITVESQPGQGTCVTLLFPFN